MERNPSGMDLVLALSALQSRLQKKIDVRLSAHGISFTEFLVLHHLRGASGNGMRRIDLAETVGLSASGVTRLLIPMEKIKLVKREANPRDARVSLVKLSRTGEQVYADARRTFEESASFLLKDPGPERTRDLFELIGLFMKEKL